MRLIDADKMRDNAIQMGFHSTTMTISEFINLQPSVDARPNIRGEWEQVVSGYAILMRCNQCKNAISEYDFFEICRKVNHGSKLLDFCPNCGADMRGENK